MENNITVADEMEISSEIKEENVKQYLTFHVGNENYGVEVSNVKEVIEYENVYRIPAVPDYIQGVINLRGDVVPVIDLACRFFERKSEITKFSCIVIVEIEEDENVIFIGFLIDAINAVLDLAEKNIESTPSFGAKIRTDFITGVGKVDDEFIILLDAYKVLDINELADF